MSDPTQLTTEELLALYARQAASPVEVLQAVTERVASLFERTFQVKVDVGPWAARAFQLDLGSRAMGFAQINRIISGHVITTVLTSLFSIFNLLLLFYYSAQLAAVALVLVIIALGVTLFALVSVLRTFIEQGKLGAIPGLWTAYALQALLLAVLVTQPRMKRR